jgi:lipid-A-disaccharide synthase-like uncharacterized protein
MLSNSTFWLGIGFAGQALFTARFLFQWLASERKRDSVVPVAFWWFSLLGGLTLLSYAIHRRDPVIIVGQGMGLVVYIRNLMLLGKARRRAARRQRRAEAQALGETEVQAPLQAESSPKPRRARGRGRGARKSVRTG